MYIVRDNSRNGRAVSWGTDRERLNEIAATNPDFEVWHDLTAGRYYCHVKFGGWNFKHPYDLDAAQHAEII